MNVNSLTTVWNQLALEVGSLQEQVDDLQDEINPKRQRMEIISCLIAITDSLEKVQGLERCSGVLRCIDELGAAQEELNDVFVELTGIRL